MPARSGLGWSLTELVLEETMMKTWWLMCVITFIVFAIIHPMLSG